ncbi:hypothetical protein UFOVP1290_475 [uncultured Caudovirales phage]|uniref:Uncharacterized protein n=1 Tax=uncultured Caudovirales phage TaxID=2100421 RepID=A0A6J5RXH7_9CAUD|nr:hypothetical protein UFOVP1290_475 [uncultured Caudovirales phage]
MLWNELDFDAQMKVLNSISDLLYEDKYSLIHEDILAAIQELKTWSNSPIFDEDLIDDKTICSEPYVAQAYYSNVEGDDIEISDESITIII